MGSSISDRLLLGPEENLLGLCLRDSGGSFTARARDLIDQGIDWQRLSKKAHQGSIAFQLYKFIKSSPLIEMCPGVFVDNLRFFYLEASARNAHHVKEAKMVLEAFRKEAIKVIPLKGTILSCRLYGDLAARDISSDFDLLIKEEDRERARILLGVLGYSLGPSYELADWQWADTFTKSQSRMIELHWDITGFVRSRQRIEGFLQGVELKELDKFKYLDFRPEELLLFLAAHLANDFSRQLRHICDIHYLIKKYQDQIHWLSVLTKARKWNLSGSLYTALKLNQDFFGDPLPVDSRKKLRPSLSKRLFIGVFANRYVVLRGGLRQRLMDQFLSYIFLELVEARSIKDYFRIFKRVFFPPRETLKNKGYLKRILTGSYRRLKQILTSP
jgi:hypothetical protein